MNKGFSRTGLGDFMSWINGDDLYRPGAFASVSQNFQGLRCIISKFGSFYDVRVGCGKMFWRSGLWQAAGGVSGGMRLAGDFDLWRRFAQHSDLVMADALLGVFRVRKGQLSASIDKYHKEIDNNLTPEEMARRSDVSQAFAAATTPEVIRAGGFECRFAINRVFAGGWHIVERP